MATVVEPDEGGQPSQALAQVATEEGHEEPTRPPGGAWLRRHVVLSLPGCWGALALACLSFTPSLLPRGFLQGLIWGITAAIGYGRVQ